MTKTIVGIDPGLRGGVAIFDPGATIPNVLALPLTKERFVDCRAIVQVIEKVSRGTPVKVYIERVWAMPKQGGVERFLKNAGMLLGMCQTSGYWFMEVLPKTWKYAILPERGGHDKLSAIVYCHNKYPSVSLLPTYRCKKPSDGIADAIVIADYGRLHVDTVGK